MGKFDSPYSASITGGGFLYEETSALLPLLQADNHIELLKDEGINNRIINVNAETSRKRFISEISRRYENMAPSFWIDWQSMDEDNRKVALFLVILKTYKILFDFHINVTMRKWNSISKSVTTEDIMLEFNEISAKDKFVDSWSEGTKKKIASAYLTILRKIGMLNIDNELQPLSCSNFDYYLTHGEPWFLEACLLQPFQIEKIKKSLL